MFVAAESVCGGLEVQCEYVIALLLGFSILKCTSERQLNPTFLRLIPFGDLLNLLSSLFRIIKNF